MKRLVFCFCVVTAFAAVVGCTKNLPKPQLVAEPDNVTLRLAQAADRAANALDTLAAIEQVRSPSDLPPLAAGAPPELRRSVTVNWIGPVEPLVRQLADRASYKVVVSGNAPEAAIIISMNARNQPVIEALRDIGLQLAARGELRVDANLKTVELSYANVQIPEIPVPPQQP
jgi:defect-in-organelle-trafficking protein DotD